MFDDQSDYFTVDNRWLSKEERDAVTKREKEMKAKKEADRKVVRVNFGNYRQLLPVPFNFKSHLALLY